MFDDLSFDIGFDTVDLDAAGLDAFSGLGGFDPSDSLADAFALDAIGLSTLDAEGFALDFDLAGLGAGSDLEDVVFAADAAQIVDLDLGSPMPDGTDLASTLDIEPGSLGEMEPGDTFGGPSLPSPFLPRELGGAAVTSGGAAVAVPYGLGSPPTDSFVLRPSGESAGRIAAKLLAKGLTFGQKLAGDVAYDEAKDQVTRGARWILRGIRGGKGSP